MTGIYTHDTEDIAKAFTREEEIAQAELEAELRQAERDFANGDFIELSDEQLDRIVETGQSPWALDESQD